MRFWKTVEIFVHSVGVEVFTLLMSLRHRLNSSSKRLLILRSLSQEKTVY